MKQIVIISTLLILFSLTTRAQNRTLENTPKVGLVLSGGGAKGLAHIGVLKVIDSLGIKIDYVAGTSMGAFIGGLYASGYSGKQIDSIFLETDFNKIINDITPRTSKPFYQRNNSEKYAVTLPFDDFKIKLPSALSRGQNVFNLLTKLTLNVNGINNFNELPIPFFCIATNIETGKQVLLEKGNLTQAIMASGALPSLFQPVTINNEVLIDGGIINNYPINELREKGIDITIGVDVQDDLLDREDIISAPDILMQINNFRTIEGMDTKIKNTNIYIKPNINDYSVVSFDEIIAIIENGKQAALNNLEDLNTLSKNRANAKRSFPPNKQNDSIAIKTFVFEGETNYSRAYLLGKLKLKPNEKISYINFEKGINNLIATNNFDSFQYQLKSTENPEEYHFQSTIKESKNKTFLKIGIHFDKLYKSAALINLTKRQFIFDNDIAALDVILGDNVRYNFEYFIDKGFYWSIGLRSRYNTFNKNISGKLLLDDSEIDARGINKMDVHLQDQTNQFYFQTQIKKDFALSIGAEHKRLKIKSETITNEASNGDYLFENTDYYSIFGDLKLDSYDNKFFPKHGVYFKSDIHMYLFASGFNKSFESFSITKADMGYAFSISDKLSFNLKSSGGLKVGDKGTQTLDFSLGGFGYNLINNFIPFLGYDFISLTGNSYIKATVIADYEVFKKQHITLEANWANIDNDIFESSEWLTLPSYSGYSIGYAVETFVGPIQVKYSYSPEQKQSVWFFNLGFWF